MDFLANTQSIYETMTAKAESVWVTVYPDPGGKNNCLFAGEGDPTDQWHLFEPIIRNAATRYNRFIIRVAIGSKNAMPQQIPVQVAGQNAGQMAAIGAMPGMYGYGQPADIGAIEKRLEEKYRNELKAELEKRELIARIDGLEYSLKERRKKSGDWTAKLESFAEATNLNLENPQSIQAISGMVMGIVDKLLGAFKPVPHATPAHALAGPRRTQVAHGQAGDGDDMPADMDEDAQPLTEEDYQALDALDILKEAGAENPGELLKKVANYYKNNPDQAKGFLNFLQ